MTSGPRGLTTAGGTRSGKTFLSLKARHHWPTRGIVMIEKPTELQVILERCITENSDETWSTFLSAFGPLIRRVYHAHADASGFSEFEMWFPGWLFYERKLHAAYRGLQAKVRCGECLTADSQDRFIANYFASIVRTAVSDFGQERRRKSSTLASESFLASIPARPATDEEGPCGRILAILPELPPELRIPFKLRYFLVLGPLSAADAAWVAQRAGLPADQIAELVAAEAESNRSFQKPLSSEFIGSLLNIPPCVDGRYSTVDQRVRRAILKIREHLAQTAEGGDE